VVLVSSPQLTPGTGKIVQIFEGANWIHCPDWRAGTRE